MAMRSTKDLKDIISGVRTKQKQNGISGAGSEKNMISSSDYNTEGAKRYGEENKKGGLSNFQSSQKVTFSGSDTEIIE